MLKRLAAIVAVPVLLIIALAAAVVGQEKSAPPSDQVAVHYTVQQGDSACWWGSDGRYRCCGTGGVVC
jgi:hypothetical protein